MKTIALSQIFLSKRDAKAFSERWPHGMPVSRESLITAQHLNLPLQSILRPLIPAEKMDIIFEVEKALAERLYMKTKILYNQYRPRLKGPDVTVVTGREFPRTAFEEYREKTNEIFEDYRSHRVSLYLLCLV